MLLETNAHCLTEKSPAIGVEMPSNIYVHFIGDIWLQHVPYDCPYDFEIVYPTMLGDLTSQLDRDHVLICSPL